ncbi:ligase-associated DNA damage response endonuclease PdeM [Pseudoxanthomonas sp. SGD-10]|nr:ligase-associated DNA damage response endonuclease PdeM [Pseudoxanthomonas sp. SGD-10]
MVTEINGEKIVLDKKRAMYVPSLETLIISDLHLGKSAHFRREGLPVPAVIGQSDLQRLGILIEKYQPHTLIITGDMFHHSYNHEVEDFIAWRKGYPDLKIILVKGNHDRILARAANNLEIEIYDTYYNSGPFCFVHQQKDVACTDKYVISGHIHPGIQLSGRAKQRLRFPCFYFGTAYALLPAFSTFTGLYIIYPQKEDKIYAITPERVFNVTI